MARCLHEVRLRAVQGESFIDSNIVMVSMRFRCTRCGQPFRAIGIGDGIRVDEPGMALDGDLVFPLVPMDEEPVRIGRC